MHPKVIQIKNRNRRKMIQQYICHTAIWFFEYLIYFIHLFKDKIVLDWFLGWWRSNERKQCPPLHSSDQKFLSHSAIDLAEMIKSRKITSHQLVKAYIDRLNEINPILNAIVDGPFMEALNEAAAIDQRIANEEVSEEEFSAKPFLGIPFTTKDSTAVKGKLHTLGIVARKTAIAHEDAECVRLMKEAGAIIIATSSVPEMNLWIETRNNVIGTTNNPYDTRRTTGGSSGGEGALVSACGSAFGIGTDIGGSIRMPAFHCGIFGHKATANTINLRGCTLRTGKEGSSMLVIGPMTRHAKDLLPIFKILVGPKMVKDLRLDEPVDVKRLKYYYIAQNGQWSCSPVSCDLQVAMKKVVKHITELAYETPIKVQPLVGMNRSFKIWRYWRYAEPGDSMLLLGNGVHLNFLAELAKKLSGNSEFTWASMICLFDDQIIPKDNPETMKELTRKCNEELTVCQFEMSFKFYY